MSRWDDRKLEQNLFADNDRPGKFRFKLPDGKKVSLKGTLTIEQANAIARAMNRKIAKGDYTPAMPDPKAPPAKGSWGDLVEQYIARKEGLEPAVLDKKNWQNMRSYLRKFGREFAHVAPHKINRRQILTWWDELSHHQQNKRHTELRRLFNWAMGEGYCPQLQYNPFTTNDDRPRLYLKSKGEKARAPLTIEQFWKVYDRAGEDGYTGLQRAMMISVLTTMREGDICKLKFSDVVDGQLRVVIGKSEAQRGAAKATRLAFVIEKSPLLRDVITQARRDSLAARRCPFIVYHKPLRERDYRSQGKEHPFQMLPDLVQKHFRKVFAKVAPDMPNPPSFHEVRALSSVLHIHSGFDIEKVMLKMAHNRIDSTQGYQDYHDLPYAEIDFGLTSEDLGRKP
jgi:hypothetical protein